MAARGSMVLALTRLLIELERDDVLGVGEGGVDRVLVAHHQPDRDIVGGLVPHRGRTGLDRVFDIDHRRQRLVVDLDELGGVLGLEQRFGDDKGDALAQGAHFADGEDRAQRAVALRSAHILRHDRRESAKTVGRDIRSGENGEHAGRGLGLGGIDALDAGMGVRRHDHDAMALLRQVDVVDKAAAAGNEAWVLEPGYRLTDAELDHAVPPGFVILPAMRGFRKCILAI